MKNVTTNLILVLSATFALNAFASSPRVVIDPLPPSETTVISLKLGGGMPGPGILASREIRVTRTGAVKVHDIYNGNPINGPRTEKNYELKTLEPIDMLAIGEAEGSLKGGALTKVSEPGCMDAPSFTYAVAKNFTLVPVFERVSCQELQLADKSQRAAANMIKYYLDTLNKEASEANK